MLCLADLSSIHPPHQAHMVSPGDMSEMVMVSLPPAVSPTADDEWIAVSPSLAPSKSKKEGVEVGPNPISRASNFQLRSCVGRKPISDAFKFASGERDAAGLLAAFFTGPRPQTPGVLPRIPPWRLNCPPGCHRPAVYLAQSSRHVTPLADCGERPATGPRLGVIRDTPLASLDCSRTREHRLQIRVTRSSDTAPPRARSNTD